MPTCQLPSSDCRRVPGVFIQQGRLSPFVYPAITGSVYDVPGGRVLKAPEVKAEDSSECLFLVCLRDIPPVTAYRAAELVEKLNSMRFGVPPSGTASAFRVRTKLL